jgi:hypothetical protein
MNNNLYSYIVALPVLVFLGLITFCFFRVYGYRSNLLRVLSVTFVLTSLVLLYGTIGDFASVSSAKELVPTVFVFFTNYFIGVLLTLYFWRNNMSQSKKWSPILILLSVVLSLSMLAGVRIDQDDLFFTSYSFINFTNFILLIGFFFVFYTLCDVAFDWLRSSSAKNICTYYSIGCTSLVRPLILVSFVLGLFWTPYIYSWYPGILPYDASVQLLQSFGEFTPSSLNSKLLNPDVPITNFHPYAHTFVISSLGKVGMWLIDFNFGVFLITCSQFLLIILVFAVVFVYFLKVGLPRWYFVFTVALYALLPVYPLMSVSISKDMHFSAFFILFVLCVYHWVQGSVSNYKIKSQGLFYLIFFVVSLPLVFFRHTGIYIYLGTLLCTLVFVPQARRAAIVMLLAMIGLFFTYNTYVLPSIGISPTPSTAMYSVPFQQTGRLVKYDRKALTKDDIKAISAVLDYSALSRNYDRRVADAIKGSYNQFASQGELRAYFEAWKRGFLSRPGIYLDATLANVYLFYSPLYSGRPMRMGPAKLVSQYGYDYSPSTHDTGIRKTIALAFESFLFLPILGLLVNVGFSTYIVLILFAYILKTRCKAGIIAFSPILIFILFYLLHPLNGALRYAMPVVYSLPLMLAIVLSSFKGVGNNTQRPI